MKKVCIAAALLLAIAAGGFTQSVARAPRPALRVLIIGNSYVYFNNLPEILEVLSKSRSSPRPIEARMFVKGGATLQRHWDEGAALAAIRQGPWD